MKEMKAFMGIVAVAVQLASPVAGATADIVNVSTCAELQTAVDTAAASTSSAGTHAVLLDGAVSCDEWTTFEVTGKLALVGPSGEESVLEEGHVFELENVRFAVASGGVLRADVPVSFGTGEGEGSQEVNGGALNVAEGAFVRFNADVFMTSISVVSQTDEGSDFTSDLWHGGCIYNQGKIRFEDYFFATDCLSSGGGESAAGNGSGIFNGDTGVIVFKSKMKMTECGSRRIEGNYGGAIYNTGKMTMFREAKFLDNLSAAGGAIYNIGEMIFLKASLAKFKRNRNSDSGGHGGQVRNAAGTMMFNGGVFFEDGFSEGDGGAISNSGTVTILKTADFITNESNSNGGAISSPSDATFTLPENSVFQGNAIRYDFFDCNVWYQKNDVDFVCLLEESQE